MLDWLERFFCQVIASSAEGKAADYGEQYDCRYQVNENRKRILKNISKLAAYTAITGGAYFLAKGALGLILKQLETKVRSRPKILKEKAEPASVSSPNIITENCQTRSLQPFSILRLLRISRRNWL
jgi:hypothetical protein